MELTFPRHEDRVTEFKASFNARAVAMTVCAFANTLGGHIFIGRPRAATTATSSRAQKFMWAW